MRQSNDQCLVCQTYTQFTLERSNDELGFISLTRCQQLLDDTDFFGLRLIISNATEEWLRHILHYQWLLQYLSGFEIPMVLLKLLA
jgi:hypothetical protein